VIDVVDVIDMIDVIAVIDVVDVIGANMIVSDVLMHVGPHIQVVL